MGREQRQRSSGSEPRVASRHCLLGWSARGVGSKGLESKGTPPMGEVGVGGVDSDAVDMVRESCLKKAEALRERSQRRPF